MCIRDRYNERFTSASEAAQAISRSTVVARAAVEKHIYDRAKLTPVNGKVRLSPEDLPFQMKGIAVETELRLPRDAIEATNAHGGDHASLPAPIAASLFFAALPLLITSKDTFYEPGEGYM